MVVWDGRVGGLALFAFNSPDLGPCVRLVAGKNFEEEYSVDLDLMRAIKEAILKTGAAAFFSASTTGAAFASLVFSGFKGFYEFGVISAYGIAITSTCMFLLTPLQLVLLNKYFPNFLKGIEIKTGEAENDKRFIDRINLDPQAIITRLWPKFDLDPEYEKLLFSF